ncbi:MAG: hypothetical protein HYS25_08050 [Ignavibacteriales bacterium]|nr:hypothetical protein [Ignavibacteriales bacterium]
MTLNSKTILKKSGIVLAGAALGYAYYYFIGCSSGSCPITSNPYISTFYGALIGFILIFPTKKKENGGAEKNNPAN